MNDRPSSRGRMKGIASPSPKYKDSHVEPLMQQHDRLNEHYTKINSEASDVDCFYSPSTSKNDYTVETISPNTKGDHRRPKTISMNDKNPSETMATQVPRASSSGLFGNARNKLKGYLGKFKPKKHPDASSLWSGAGESHLSGTKTPKYRRHSSNSKSPDALTNTTKNSPQQIASNQFSVTDSDDGGKSYTDSVKTKYYDKDASVSFKKFKKKSVNKKLPKKIEQPRSDIPKIHMFDLPWSDNRPNSRLQGRYSGPVDAKLLPHGKGTLVLQGHETSKFYGTFEHGNLASSLICKSEDDEIIDVGEIGRTSKPSSPIHTGTIRRGQEPSGALYNETPLNLRHSQQDMFEQQGRPVKMPTAARRLSTGTFTQDVEHYFAMSATDPVSTPKYRKEAENQYCHQVKVPAAKRRATIETAQYSMESDQLNQLNNLQSKPLTRHPYNLNDVARTPKDMITYKSNTEAIHSASLLKINDLAFLKRSNGLWTAAILADRSLQPTMTKHHRSAHWYSEWEVDSSMKVEECMLFVINEDGATKIVQRRHWGRFVRRMIEFGADAVIKEEKGGHNSA